MAVKVSSKYQVVIPESVRKTLKITPGMEVDVIVKGDIAYIVPIPGLTSLQEDLQGKVNHKSVREKKDRKL